MVDRFSESVDHTNLRMWSIESINDSLAPYDSLAPFSELLKLFLNIFLKEGLSEPDHEHIPFRGNLMLKRSC